MRIFFGLHQDGAAWSDAPAALGEVALGPAGMLAWLQTRLGLGGLEEPPALRLDQYRRRLEAADSREAWFQKSFALDPWATAKQLLAWRDELIAAGWDGRPLPETTPRLAALSALEERLEPLAPGFADRLREALTELPWLDTSAVASIQLAEPLELLPRLWQLAFAKLRELGVAVESTRPKAPAPKTSNLGLLQACLLNPPLAAKGGPIGRFKSGDESLVLLEADTELETAAAVAMWLAAEPGENGRVALVAPGGPGLLDPALRRLGLPRLGGGEVSKWRAHLQLLPLVFANAWEPIEFQALREFLALPVGPLRFARSRLLTALTEAGGVGGAKWVQALAGIRELYLNPREGIKAKTPAEAEQRLKQLDAMLISDRYLPGDGIPAAAVQERCRWVISHLAPKVKAEPRLAEPLRQAEELIRLAQGRGKLSRIELERMLDALIGAGSAASGQEGEAAAWLSAPHPGGLPYSRSTLIWWNFVGGAPAAETFWSKAERADLLQAGVCLDEPGQARRREAFAWRNALLKATERAILARPRRRKGEETLDHPFWDEIL
ncbi:MAG: hypothetical protein LBV15_05760, partial [Planctomycetota bacterium]|nr:hypothetical protein [Planctomycetota bacterium]